MTFIDDLIHRDWFLELATKHGEDFPAITRELLGIEAEFSFTALDAVLTALTQRIRAKDMS